MANKGKKIHPRNSYWSHGEVLALAKESGVSYRALFLILHRSRRASFPIASKLEQATARMRRPIDRNVWLNNLTTDHPAFRVKDETAPPDKESLRPNPMFVNIDKKSETNSDGSV
jgi:hypothetical protein